MNRTPEPLAESAQLARGPGLPWWLAALPMFAFAACRELWAPDEPRYAEVARSMWERGEFFVMQRCGALYPDKPPGLFWLTAPCGAASGWSEFALRLPSLVATLLVAALLARRARLDFGRAAGAWAAVVFLGFFEVSWMGGRLALDPLLMLCAVAAIELWRWRARSAWSEGLRSLLVGLALAYGVWTKGPVLLATVALVLVGEHFALPPAWRAREPRQHSLWPRLLGLALGVLPIALALRESLAREPLLEGAWLHDQHVGRLTEGGAGKHWNPPWYYFEGLALYLWPWSLAFAVALVAAARAWWHGWRGSSANSVAGEQSARARALVWFALLLLFFSALPPKRELYLLPAYPAAALLVAGALPGWLAREPSRVLRWSAGLVGAVFALCAAALAVLALAHARVGQLLSVDVPVTSTRAALAAVLAALAAVAAYASLRRTPLVQARTLAWSFAFGLAGLYGLLLPAIDADKSARAVAEELSHLSDLPSEIPCVGVQPEGYAFYAEPRGALAMRDATLVDLAPALERHGARFRALVRDQDFAKLSREEQRRYRVLFVRDVGSRTLLWLAPGP